MDTDRKIAELKLRVKRLEEEVSSYETDIAILKATLGRHEEILQKNIRPVIEALVSGADEALAAKKKKGRVNR